MRVGSSLRVVSPLVTQLTEWPVLVWQSRCGGHPGCHNHWQNSDQKCNAWKLEITSFKETKYNFFLFLSTRSKKRAFDMSEPTLINHPKCTLVRLQGTNTGLSFVNFKLASVCQKDFPQYSRRPKSCRKKERKKYKIQTVPWFAEHSRHNIRVGGILTRV